MKPIKKRARKEKAPKIKGRYYSPEIQERPLERVSRTESPVPTYRIDMPDNRTFYMRKHVTQEMLNAQHHARKAIGGKAIEEPFMEKPMGPERIAFYRDAGRRTLVNEILRIQKLPKSDAQKKDAIRKLAEKTIGLVARMHTMAGEEHGHPHSKNITIYEKKGKKKKVRLIDFKRAEKRKVNWSNAESVFEAFKRDYIHLNSVFIIMDFRDKTEREALFRELVEQYPMSVEEKRKLVDLIHDFVMVIGFMRRDI